MKRNIKIIAGLVIAGFLLVSIISASLLTYFGRITGTVTVEGPVFYATSSVGEPGSLTINEFEGEGYTYTISGQDEKVFISNQISPTNFYAPKLNLSVEARLYNGTQPKLLELEFGYYDNFIDGISYPFCGERVTINVTSNQLKVYSNICNGVSVDKLEGFYYSIKGRGTGDVQIKVRTSDENTKVKVLGVAT